MEGEEYKGPCPNCGGKLTPLIDCSSCGVRTVREELTPVQESERCPVCDSPAKVAFECPNCNEMFSFADIVGEERGKLVCPMCSGLVDPDATSCQSCGSSFVVQEPERIEPERDRLRKRRRVIGDYEEEDVLEIMRIPGVGRLRAEVLCRAGYTALNKINRASVEDLAKIRQIGMRTAKSIKEALQMMYVEPEESQRLMEEFVEEEFECPVCRTIVSAYDTECVECGAAFERVLDDEGFIEEIEKVGEEKSSLSLFDMKLLESPKDPQLWVARGGLLRKMENYEEALKSYDRAIEIQPGLKTAWIAKAKILNRLGRLDEAASCYREIVDESAAAAGIELGEEEEAMAALEELLAEDCPSCGSPIPLGSNTCPSCGHELVEDEAEVPLKALETVAITEDLLEKQLKELEAEPPPAIDAKAPGLTNGLGRVNGRGKVNGMGMVNGKGLVNGRGAINGRGRVNGLINGNGFTNGLSLSRITKARDRKIWPRYVALGVAVLIFVLLLGGLMPEFEDRAPPIVIDGEFHDWDDTRLYTEQSPGTNPDTSIVNYGFRVDDGYFSYLIGVQGVALGDLSGYDSYYLFIDKDNDPSTGYIVRDMGAEHMVEAFGGSGEVAGSPIYGYTDSQDRTNFTQWQRISTGRAAVGGSRMEGQFTFNSLLDMNEDFSIRFCADDYEGGVTYSSVRIGPDYGALLITQEEVAPNAVLTGNSGDLLQLRFEARGVDVSVDSVSFDVVGAVAEEISNIEIPAGSSVTRTVSVDTSQSLSGELIDISVSSVVANVPYTVRGDGAKAYYDSSPSQPEVDGWFGEWDGQTQVDDDTSPVTNPNIDIQKSGVIKNTADDDAYFYLQVEDELLGGFSSPQVRHKFTSSGPAQPAPPLTQLKRMGGEDRTYVYIDSNTSDDTEGKWILGMDIKPDYMIRIHGIYGEISSTEMCHWNPGWSCTEGVQVQKDMSRMELSAIIPGISSSEMGVVFASTDWRQRGDKTDSTTRSEGSRGLGGPELMQPSWPNDTDWISAVTDPDEGFSPLRLEILEVYVYGDNSYLYVRIRTEANGAPPLSASTWWVYLDTDGDGVNNWIVVEMSSTGTGRVWGLEWDTIAAPPDWGISDPPPDWDNSINDGDGDSAVRTAVMTIGLDDYGCVDFAILLSNIDTIEDDATLAAADDSSEDQTLFGRTNNIPIQALAYIVDCTDPGDIPEFETILAPILLMILVPTVMIKRRKRYSGSQTPRGGSQWKSASSESQMSGSRPSSQRRP